MGLLSTTRIRDYLGHSSVATTESYYVARGQVDDRDVAELSFGAAPGNDYKSDYTPESSPGRNVVSA